MKEIKITEKTSKRSLVGYLKSYVFESPVVDKNLADRVNYALSMFNKDQTKVKKEDLFDLAREVEAMLANVTPLTVPTAPAPVEASLKPVKSQTPTEEVQDEPAEEEAEAEPEAEEVEESQPEKVEAPKKSGKKSTLKKSTKDSKKKTEVETLPAASNVGADRLPSAKMFPAEIDHPELGKLIACTGAYTTYADVLSALEAEKTLYFACYWTKRHVKEYTYAHNFVVDSKSVANGFPLDLDIAMAVVPCETMERVFAMSRYTEAMYMFNGEHLQYVEDTDPRSGAKFSVRVATGMEFEIYRPEDEDIVTTE